MSTRTRPETRRPVATLKDVAERAGVSQMTVSRVLNAPAKVRKQTAEKVREAIEALNFRPNYLAKSLADGRSILIGLLYNNPSDQYLSQVMFGALRACRERSHHLLVQDFLFETDLGDTDAVTSIIRQSGVQALIVCPPIGEDPSAKETLEKLGLPFVRIAPGRETDGAPYVEIDDRDAAKRMTQHLLDLGHRDIAFIAGPEDQVSSRRRTEGFKEAMTVAGLPVPDEFLRQGAYTYRSGMEAALPLLQSAKRPSAVFAANDDMAAGVLAAAMQAGLSVPGDLSVAGFDDVSLATTVWPSLTTVRQPIAEMAERAVGLLETDTFGQEGERSALLPTEIIERESTARFEG
ncbi:LacI family DNA-binding transcriptional regulator [Parvularcula sp. ZS-1/3]|uniref:LacI family DNA-binding transcriptional regulator n=1 Tax=Parvularcula mediterranea TaxID=2732508 RepID=A0A7Y3W662_9PROT|nr:LacI family DNA-binding transcriptional regulator [Parvularcula mediterranea]NNU17032.1 LacI family DNA-binding transcriptional regulator [Parvularcula mediterranea]